MLLHKSKFKMFAAYNANSFITLTIKIIILSQHFVNYILVLVGALEPALTRRFSLMAEDLLSSPDRFSSLYVVSSSLI
jgi:hypothetical protein